MDMTFSLFVAFLLGLYSFLSVFIRPLCIFCTFTFFVIGHICLD